MKQHKWHKEIKAWADGAEIEHRWNDGEIQTTGWKTSPNPNWNSLMSEYRIKPQDICKCQKQTCSALKEPQYLYAYLQSDGNYKFGRFNCKYNGEKPLGKIKLEVDDE